MIACVSEEFLEPFTPQEFAEEMGAVHEMIRAKAVEFANEKTVCVERIN